MPARNPLVLGLLLGLTFLGWSVPAAAAAGGTAGLTSVAQTRGSEPLMGTQSTSLKKPLTKTQKKKIQKQIKLAKKYTKKKGKVTFDSKRAIKKGMSKKFAKSYAKYLKAATERINQMAKFSTMGLMKPLTPKKSDTLGCTISVLGMIVTTVGLCMAVAATYGVAAVAVAGFGLSGAAVIEACY